MTTLITILALLTLGAVTVFGIVSERATLKRLDKLKRGEIGKSTLSEDGMRETYGDDAEPLPS